MKRAALILGIVLSLSSSTVKVRAHGGCYGFWPFWPLALGTTVAVAAAASAHSSPTYVYVPPAYPYGYAYPYAQPQHSSGSQPAQEPAATGAPITSNLELTSRWVPNSPGAGHWVPDPTPYNYDAGSQTRVIAANVQPAAPTVTINRSVGDIPVYTVTR